MRIIELAAILWRYIYKPHSVLKLLLSLLVILNDNNMCMHFFFFNSGKVFSNCSNVKNVVLLNEASQRPSDPIKGGTSFKRVY